MTEISENHKEIREYLLGSLSEEVQQQFEERLMTESSFLEELEVCEDELIDDYLNDDLVPDSRARFEQHFLCTPKRRQKLKFAMALERYASHCSRATEIEPSDKRYTVPTIGLTWSERFSAVWNAHAWAFRTAATVAIIAIVAAPVWLWNRGSNAPTTLATLNLSISNSERAEGTPASKIKLPLNAKELRISLKLPDAAPASQNYRVELKTGRGSIKNLDVEGRDSQSLSVVIPAAQLGQGDYALRLFMISSDGSEQRVNGSYFFTVQ